MRIVQSIKDGYYIESENGEKVQLYAPYDKNAINKAWEFGMEEAWETARKIVCGTNGGGLSLNQLDKIFKTFNYETIFKLFDAKQAIKK